MDTLLVEDALMARATMESVLTAQGHQVTVASSGGEGLTLYHRLPPQLVITDWNMPDSNLDGIGLVQAIRHHIQRDCVYINMVTANASRQHLVETFLENNLHHHVSHALCPECLAGQNNRVLQKKQKPD